jgi:hypothetical protein
MESCTFQGAEFPVSIDAGNMTNMEIKDPVGEMQIDGEIVGLDVKIDGSHHHSGGQAQELSELNKIPFYSYELRDHVSDLKRRMLA